MIFRIRIEYERRNRYYNCEVILTDKITERIKVSGRNRFIVIQSNRPLLVSKGLKHRRIDWKIVEGDMNSPFVLGLIYDEVEKYLKSLP